MIQFRPLDPRVTAEHLGLLPFMLDANDPDSASQQFDKHYQHGGGWIPFEGHTIHDDNSISYPGDPPLEPIAQARLRDELILVYPHSWVAVVQPDRSCEICRMD